MRTLASEVKVPGEAVASAMAGRTPRARHSLFSESPTSRSSICGSDRSASGTAPSRAHFESSGKISSITHPLGHRKPDSSGEWGKETAATVLADDFVVGSIVKAGRRDGRPDADVEPPALSWVRSLVPVLYTGVTRGKRLVVLVGQKKAVAIAVRNMGGPSFTDLANSTCWSPPIRQSLALDPFSKQEGAAP